METHALDWSTAPGPILKASPRVSRGRPSAAIELISWVAGVYSCVVDVALIVAWSVAGLHPVAMIRRVCQVAQKLVVNDLAVVETGARARLA